MIASSEAVLSITALKSNSPLSSLFFIESAVLFMLRLVRRTSLLSIFSSSCTPFISTPFRVCENSFMFVSSSLKFCEFSLLAICPVKATRPLFSSPRILFILSKASSVFCVIFSTLTSRRSKLSSCSFIMRNSSLSKALPLPRVTFKVD